MPGLATSRAIIVLRILLYFHKQLSSSCLKKDFWNIWKVKENPLSQSNTFSTRSLRCSWHGRCEEFSKSWERLKVGWKICSSQLEKRFPLLNSSGILASLANEGKVENLSLLKLIWKTNNDIFHWIIGQLRCYEENIFCGAWAFESFAVNDYHRKQSTSLFCNFDVNDHPSSVRGPL